LSAVQVALKLTYDHNRVWTFPEPREHRQWLHDNQLPSQL